jgi:hypothetical protein
MRIILILIVAASAAGCLRTTQFHCGSNADCVKAGAQGTCESIGYCSFLDPSCASGQRFGDLSGQYSQTCVGDLPFVDGGVDGSNGGSDGSGSDGGGSNDTDGDGIANAVDNCPTVANANQDNEDGDKFGDVCDPCPPIANDNPPDADGDGVADACDPNPATAGDSIFLFEGFKQGIPASWENVGGWTATGGDATLVAANIANLATPGPTTGKDTVSASITLDSVSGMISTISVIDDKMAGADSSIICGPFRAPVAGSPGLAIADTNNLAGYTGVAYQMTVGQTYVIKLKRDLMAFTCTAANGGATAAVPAQTYALNNTPPSAGLRIAAAGVHAHWLMIVRSP